MQTRAASFGSGYHEYFPETWAPGGGELDLSGAYLWVHHPLRLVCVINTSSSILPPLFRQFHENGGASWTHLLDLPQQMRSRTLSFHRHKQDLLLTKSPNLRANLLSQSNLLQPAMNPLMAPTLLLEKALICRVTQPR